MTATITLNRPERLNAQTPLMWSALREVGRVLPGSVRVVVVRGEGRAFSAGLDRAAFTDEGVTGSPGLLDLAAMPSGEAEELIGGFQEAFGWLRRTDLVSVAAVRGHAVGAGFQLALACDLRVLADDARLRMAETGLGLVPDLGGTARLAEAVGYSRALEICVTGREVAADEAARIGLATIVVAPSELDGALDDLVAALLVPNRGAVSEVKALLRSASGVTDQALAGQEAAERAAQVRRLRDLAGLD